MSDVTSVRTGDSVPVVSETEPKEPGTSLSELMGRLGEDVSGLVTTQLEIAKAELKKEATDSAKAAGVLGGGALAGYLAVLLLSFAAAWGIAEAWDAWAGFLVVGLVWAVIAAVLAATGKKKMQEVKGPEATAAELKADQRLAKDLRS
ncbi:MAG TPA: phage holin family protein [Acidimicrobiales bacterium]|nr:phage holin family protein [Acidimicrobiales bacterium]